MNYFNRQQQNSNRSLSDILGNQAAEELAAEFDRVEATPDYSVVVPPGEYLTRVLDSKLEEVGPNRTLTYKIRLQIIDGPCAGRMLFSDIWITSRSLPRAKRALGKLGINNLRDQIQQSLRGKGIRVKVKVVVRKNDKGKEYNEVDLLEAAEPESRSPYAVPDSEIDDAAAAQDATDAFNDNGETEVPF